MTNDSYEQALRVAEALPREEQLRLIQELAQYSCREDRQPTSVMELCGLGLLTWRQADAQEYVDSERASWNG